MFHKQVVPSACIAAKTKIQQMTRLCPFFRVVARLLIDIQDLPRTQRREVTCFRDGRFSRLSANGSFGLGQVMETNVPGSNPIRYFPENID